MKPVLQLLKWFFTFWFFMFPVMICGSYFVQGCSKTKWMNFLVESSDISFAILPLTGMISGFILAAYALQRMYYLRYNPKPKPPISKDDLRDIVMSGGLSKSNDSYRDWFTTRFNN